MVRGCRSLGHSDDEFRSPRGSGSPARVDLVREGCHPVVGQDDLQRLPHHRRWIVNSSNRHKNVGPMDGKALATHPTRAKNHRAPTRLSMQTDRRQNTLSQPKRSAVRLDLVADLNRRIDRIGRGSSQDGPVVEQHRRRTVMIIIMKPVADQRRACVDRRRKLRLAHDRDFRTAVPDFGNRSRPRTEEGGSDSHLVAIWALSARRPLSTEAAARRGLPLGDRCPLACEAATASPAAASGVIRQRPEARGRVLSRSECSQGGRVLWRQRAADRRRRL